MKKPVEISEGATEVLALEKFVQAARTPSVVSYEPDFDDTDAFDLRHYWHAVLKRWWLIVLTAVLATSLAAVYAARKPDVYQAEASIQVDAENNPALGSRKGEAVIINNTASDPSYFNTQILILQSPALLRRVAKTLDLEHDPAFVNPQLAHSRSTWRGFLEMVGLQQAAVSPREANVDSLRVSAIAPESRDEDMSEARRLAPYVAALQKGLEVDVKQTTHLIEIKFNHADPRTTARIANVTADVFVLTNLERRTKTNADAGQFLQKRIAELQANIRNNEERLIRYSKEHQLISLDPGENFTTDRLSTLSRDVLAAENARKAAETEYKAALEPGAAQALVEGTGSNPLAILESRLAELRQRREVLLLEAGENWPEVKELSKQISQLEEQIAATRQRAITLALTNLETRYRQAAAREQSLRAAFEEQRGHALAQNEAAINYRMIQQETTTYKTLLDDMLQRSKENDLILAETPNNVHVLDYAISPGALVGPKRLRFVGLAFAFSMAFGVGLALVLGHFDDTLRIGSVEEVERMFGLPALAVIPSTADLAHRRLLPRIKALGGRNGDKVAGRLLYSDTRSPLAESFRQLRTAIMLSGGRSAPGRILFTSSLPSEGKTTSVVNTAMLLEQTGAKVLVIDADLRHPTLHKIFDVENERGLSTVLSNETSEVELFDTIEKYKDTQLYVLPSGPVPSNPAELLGSERMRKFLKTFDSVFTHIIIDSPPIAYFTDGVLLSSMVDNVLLVVNGSKGSREATRHALQLMQSAGAQMLGVVLNDVSLRAHNYNYYQHYYRQLSNATASDSEPHYGSNGNGGPVV